jgi:hypothetical protein
VPAAGHLQRALIANFLWLYLLILASSIHLAHVFMSQKWNDIFLYSIGLSDGECCWRFMDWLDNAFSQGCVLFGGL